MAHRVLHLMRHQKMTYMLHSNDSNNFIPQDKNIQEIATVAYTDGENNKYGLLCALSVFGRIVLILSRDGKQNDLVITGKYSYRGKEYNSKAIGDTHDFFFNIPETLVNMVEVNRHQNKDEFPLV